MPSPDEQTADQIATALQAGLGVKALIETLYQQIGSFTVPRAYNVQATAYALIVRPGWNPLSVNIDDFVFLAEKKP